MTPFSTDHCSLPTFTHPVRSVPLNNDTQFSPGAFGAAAGPDCARATVARAHTSTHEFASCFIMAGSVTRCVQPEGPPARACGYSGLGSTMSDQSMLHSPELDE